VCAACFDICRVDEQSDGFPLVDLKKANKLMQDKPESTYFMEPHVLLKEVESSRLTNPLIVACADMGAQLPFITAAAPVLVAQNFGHKAPSCAELNFMIQGASCDTVVIYGHTNCQYLAWLKSNGHAPESQSACLEVSCNAVLAQISILRDAIQQNQIVNPALKLIGWLYNDETGELLVYDPGLGKFSSCLQFA
jgi:carbonic anhydrase